MAYLWKWGATTVKELETELHIKPATISLTLRTLQILELLQVTATVKTRGRSAKVYALTIATPQASVDAQLRYGEKVKRKREQIQARKRRELRLREEKESRKRETEERLRESLEESLVEELAGLGDSIDINELSRRCRPHGLEWRSVGRRLLERGVTPWYYVGGEPDPTWTPPPEWAPLIKNPIRTRGS